MINADDGQRQDPFGGPCAQTMRDASQRGESLRQVTHLEALFGGPQARSSVETSVLERAGAADPGIRSAVGDPATATVAKGSVTRDIVAAPEGDGANAVAVIPG